MWTHLGLAILLHRDQINAMDVLKLGSELGERKDVDHGLAIAAHIFPELADWVKADTLDMPRWERKYAVPLAARRLIMGERE